MEHLMSDHIYHINEQVFTAKTLYRELHNQLPVQYKSSNPLLFNDLVQLVRGNPRLDTQQLMQRVNQSIPLRRQFMQLAQSLAFATSPIQAAASSIAKISNRKTAEFELLFKPDTQFPEQVYVVLKIPHAKETHQNNGVRVNCCSDQLISAIHFPPIVDGKTQLLMEESDQRFINMFDTEFAIYLS